MRVLGLDPSLTSFGWCLLNDEKVVLRGRFETKPDALFVTRYIGLQQSLLDLLQETKPEKVGLESSVFNSSYSEGMYGLFLYVCETLWRFGVDVVLFTPPQVKTRAREFLERPDKWQMKKPDMVEAAKLASQISKWNHNEADAFWIAFLANRFWLLQAGQLQEENLTSTEKHLFYAKVKPAKGDPAVDWIGKGLAYREGDRFYRWSMQPPTQDERCLQNVLVKKSPVENSPNSPKSTRTKSSKSPKKKPETTS